MASGRVHDRQIVYVRKKGSYETFAVFPDAPILERVKKNEDDMELISKEDHIRYMELQRQEMLRLAGKRIATPPNAETPVVSGQLEDMTKKQLAALIELEALPIVMKPNISKGEMIEAIKAARLGQTTQAPSDEVPPPAGDIPPDADPDAGKEEPK